MAVVPCCRSIAMELPYMLMVAAKERPGDDCGALLHKHCGSAVVSVGNQLPRSAQAMAVVPRLQRESQEKAVMPPMPIRDQSGKAK